MSTAEHTGTTLARLSCQLPRDRLGEFEAAYETRLLPILESNGLAASGEVGRPAAPGVFARLYESESPSAIIAAEHALKRDAAWLAALRDQAATCAVGAAAGTLPYHLSVYSCPAGPGTTMPAGSGFRQGLWLTLSPRDGLASGGAFGILQDHRGDMWFASHGQGLSRFDGTHFTNFTVADGLADDRIHAFIKASNGDFWLGTHDGGATHYDGNRFITYTTADGLPSNEVYSLFEDAHGSVWLGTHGGGVSCFDGESFTTLTTRDGLASDVICCIQQDLEGCMWFGTGWQPQEGNGVSCFDGESFVTYTTADGLGDNTLWSATRDAQGRLWFGTLSGGVSCYDGTSFTTLTTDDGLSHDSVMTVFADRDGCMWFGVENGGVTRYDGSSFATFTTENGLGANTIRAIAQDREGHLWFGGHDRASYFDAVQLTLSARDGLPATLTGCMIRDRHGVLWLGTARGVNRYVGGEFPAVDALQGHHVVCMMEDREEHIWIGTMAGELLRYDGDVADTVATEGSVVTAIAQDLEGNIWFGTRARSGHAPAGLCRYDGVTTTRFTSGDGLPGDSVNDILIAEETLWLATGAWEPGHLVRYDGERFTPLTGEGGPSTAPASTETQKLPRARVTGLLLDSRGNLWCATQGSGVYCYDGTTFRAFTTADGLAHGRPLLEDARGHIWFGTMDGVARYDGTVFQSLSRRNGLPLDTATAIIEDQSGDIWIASDGGIMRYHPGRTPPTVRIVDVIADRRYEPKPEIRLPASQALVILVEGSSLSTHLDGMAYVYRLQGHDDSWQSTNSARVEYRGLGPGEYTFDVKAVDRDLNYSEPASVRITVEPDLRLQALTEALSSGGSPGEFLGRSKSLRDVQTQLEQVAHTGVTVLILGETGTGKGLAARTVHGYSERASGPFIQINCGALPEGLVESELFGHERGAFTGAHARKLGKVELADGGTLFLDEIGDLSPEAQVKLLRLLEERSFERVGGGETLQADTRIIAATNRDLQDMVTRGSFREDLFYRLQVFPVRMPPLRERREDIPLLAAYFMEKMATHLNKPKAGIDPDALSTLQAHTWPGNVRELEHMIQRAVIVGVGPTIQVDDLSLGADPVKSASAETAQPTLEEHERQYIVQVLEQTDWQVSGTGGAAAKLGVHEATLRSRMKRLGILRPSS